MPVSQFHIVHDNLVLLFIDAVLHTYNTAHTLLQIFLSMNRSGSGQQTTLLRENGFGIQTTHY